MDSKKIEKIVVVERRSLFADLAIATVSALIGGFAVAKLNEKKCECEEGMVNDDQFQG